MNVLLIHSSLGFEWILLSSCHQQSLSHTAGVKYAHPRRASHAGHQRTYLCRWSPFERRDRRHRYTRKEGRCACSLRHQRNSEYHHPVPSSVSVSAALRKPKMRKTHTHWRTRRADRKSSSPLTGGRTRRTRLSVRRRDGSQIECFIRTRTHTQNTHTHSMHPSVCVHLETRVLMLIGRMTHANTYPGATWLKRRLFFVVFA